MRVKVTATFEVTVDPDLEETLDLEEEPSVGDACAALDDYLSNATEVWEDILDNARHLEVKVEPLV